MCLPVDLPARREYNSKSRCERYKQDFVMTEKSSGNSTAVSLKARVRGHVQGVGFRVFIRSAAWRLGIRGYVRNLPDGTVQMVASGTREAVDHLLQQVWRGPAGAHVLGIESEWQDGELPGLAPQFEVRL